MASSVAVISCNTYDELAVQSAVEQGLQCLGGISQFTGSAEKILLKPNLLVGDAPSKAVTTHPAVFKAVAKLFQSSGAVVSYGDSPGKGKPERIAAQAGIKEIADELKVTLADFITAQKVSFPDALLTKQLFLAAGALEADGIVSLPKMKTHGFTRITGAVKNQFGCIPGLRKAEYHVKMPDIFEFSKVLVDINGFLKPRLYIMDGIVAMEGNGPRGGEPVAMNVLLFSSDPVALDTVCCRLMDLKPEFVPTMKWGHESGLGTCLWDEISIVGCENFEGLINKKFDAVRRKPDRMVSTRYFPTFFKNLVSPRPRIDYERCVNCGACILQCPVEPRAVNWPDGNNKEKPVFNYNDCIRCYCCQEICPDKAIDIKVPLLGKLIY